jgi:hypothetical protein
MALVGVENQAAVDFVGADDEVVRFGQGGNGEQFIVLPAAPDRVVRVAEQEEFALGGQRRRQRRVVELPAGVAAAPAAPSDTACCSCSRRRTWVFSVRSIPRCFSFSGS